MIEEEYVTKTNNLVLFNFNQVYKVNLNHINQKTLGNMNFNLNKIAIFLLKLYTTFQRV